MRVLFTTAWYPNRKVAGDGVFVQKHARALAAYHDVAVLMVQTDLAVKGWHVDIEAPKGNFAADVSAESVRLNEVLVYVPKIRPEVPVITGLLRLFWLMVGFIAGYRYILKHYWQGRRPEVCHVNVLTRAAGLPWVLRKLHGIPYIITEHWSRYHREGAFPASRLHLWFTRLVVRDADYVCPVSLNLEQSMKQWGLQNKRYVRVGNVVDTDVFSLRPTPQVSEKPVQFLHVSWLRDDAKNISGLLRVLARLKDDPSLTEMEKPFFLRLVGEGNDKDQLISLAEELGLLPEYVSFVGIRKGETLVEELHKSDALVMFSHFENQPVSVLEALSCGLPVIATSVGALPVMLAQNRGITVPPADEFHLYQVLSAFILLRKNMTREQLEDRTLDIARREYVERQHSPGNIARQFGVLYRSALSMLVAMLLFLLPSSVFAAIQESLPVIDIAFDETQFNKDSFIPASFCLHTDEEEYYYKCEVRHRGAYSLHFEKPSYAIKFLNKEGKSLDVSFLDMRKDNYWILDAMSSDFSKLRNRVSMDLWLDFSHKPYHQAAEPKVINGYRGKYVEIYVNGRYDGLYCLMERIDRKQLRLKKFDEDSYHGLLYKAVNNYNVRTPFFLYQSDEPDDTQKTYDGMQCEYPDVSDGEPSTWQPLRDNIYFLAAKSGELFNSRIGEYFDLPVFFDYILFVDLLYAADNIGKNLFLWYYDQASDQRLGISLWDLDMSWGRNYDGAEIEATKVLSNKSNFHKRFLSYYDGYTKILEDRYAELRASFWDETVLCARFDAYFALLDESEAWLREQSRWSGHGINLTALKSEQNYIHHWIHDRLAFLDGVYHYHSPMGIQDVQFNPSSTVTYDLMGRKVDGQRSSGFQIQVSLDRNQITIVK